MIYIYYTRIKEELPGPVYKEYLQRIPKALQERNLKFIRWKDRHANLFGKILLKQALEKHAYDPDSLQHLKYDEYNRPYLFPEIDFNISHSGEMVICAIGFGIRIGIDIERIAPIDFESFNKVMTADQWNIINQSDHPLKTFFRFWTIKESVVKADSRGLSIPLLDIHIEDNIGYYNNKAWFLNCLKISNDYSCYLASDSKDSSINIEYKTFHGRYKHSSLNEDICDLMVYTTRH